MFNWNRTPQDKYVILLSVSSLVVHSKCEIHPLLRFSQRPQHTDCRDASRARSEITVSSRSPNFDISSGIRDVWMVNVHRAKRTGKHLRVVSCDKSTTNKLCSDRRSRILQQDFRIVTAFKNAVRLMSRNLRHWDIQLRNVSSNWWPDHRFGNAIHNNATRASKDKATLRFVKNCLAFFTLFRTLIKFFKYIYIS